MAVTAAWLVQRTVLGQTWTETVHGTGIHFASVFGGDVFTRADIDDEHAGHYAPAGGAAPAGTTPAAFDLGRFDRIVCGHFVVYNIVHARFYRADGRIVYSYKPDEIGRPISDFVEDGGVARSLRGETSVESGRLPAESAPDGHPRADMLSFSMPVRREARSSAAPGCNAT